MTRGELLDRMSSRELTDWQIYERIEPFETQRQDLRMGMLMALFANANRDPKKRSAHFEASEFMPFLDDPDTEEGPLSPDEIAARVAAAWGAAD